jgi:hypothetical protein
MGNVNATNENAKEIRKTVNAVIKATLASVFIGASVMELSYNIRKVMLWLEEDLEDSK